MFELQVTAPDDGLCATAPGFSYCDANRERLERDAERWRAKPGYTVEIQEVPEWYAEGDRCPHDGAYGQCLLAVDHAGRCRNPLWTDH